MLIETTGLQEGDNYKHPPPPPHCLKNIQYIHFNTKQPASTVVEWVTAQVLHLYLNFSALGKFFPPIPLIVFNHVIRKLPFVRGYCTNIRLIFLAMVYWITEILKCSFFLCLLKFLQFWCSKNEPYSVMWWETTTTDHTSVCAKDGRKVLN